MKRRVLKVTAGVVALVAVLAAVPFVFGAARLVEARGRSPEASLRAFCGDRWAAEDQIADPLVLAGSRVVPIVLRAVVDTAMPCRRYAVGFLGWGGYRDALPALERILADSSERDYFRGDAVVAIYQIDSARGLVLAERYRGRPDYLGQMAAYVIAGDYYVRYRRTLSDAMLGRHD